MKRILGLLFACAFVLLVFYGFVSYRNNDDRLFARVSEQIRNDDFEELYSESSDSVKTSFTEEEFIKKMRVVKQKLEIIDKNLQFERDLDWEQRTFAGEANDYGYRYTVQRISNDETSAFVMVFWDDRELLPKFQDIAVTRTDDINNNWSESSEFKGLY